jgi:DNA-binding response OmpR family regulator
MPHPSTTPHYKSDPPTRHPLILVVDDDPRIRTLLRRRLQRAGFAVCEASNGYEALAFLARTTVSLILLDILMPELSGTDVVQQLRADTRFAPTPIILMTASPIVRPQARPHPLGDMLFFTKPFAFEQLLAAIRRLVPAPTTGPSANLTAASSAPCCCLS